MNVGDLVKITHKDNPDLWCSGIVIRPEDEFTWATVKSMREQNFMVNRNFYDVEVIRAVEPKTIGSVYTDKNKVRWTKFTDSPSYNYQWISEYSLIDGWKNIQ
jgi:hypothetical protein